MRDVAGAAETAAGTSHAVLGVADDVARVAGAPRGEVDQFLAAMRAGEAERRRHERVPGNGLRAVPRPRGGGDIEAVVHDISRGGAALACDAVLETGTEVELMLSAAGGPLKGRVAFTREGNVGVTFSHDAETVAWADRVLDALTGRGEDAKAA